MALLTLHTCQPSTVTLTSPGNMELLWQIGLNMHLDPATLDTREGFLEFLYLAQVRHDTYMSSLLLHAQVYQAVSLRTETETYRSPNIPPYAPMSTFARRAMVPADPVTGEGYTMGALYWQLNDIWQVVWAGHL